MAQYLEHVMEVHLLYAAWNVGVMAGAPGAILKAGVTLNMEAMQGDKEGR